MPAPLEVAQVGVGCFVSCYAVGIMFGREWLHHNGIGRRVQGDHKVLIAAPGSWREAAGVVHEDFGDGDNCDVKRGCPHESGAGRRGGMGGWLLLSRPNMLVWLRHMPLVGFLGVRAVFSHQCRREPWPGLISAMLNGIEPGALDRVASSCMEIVDEDGGVRKVISCFGCPRGVNGPQCLGFRWSR